MASFIPDRVFNLAILREYVKNEGLIRHALAVEAVMRYFAELFCEKEVDKWGTIGLLHDIDYERYPGQALLNGKGDSFTPWFSGRLFKGHRKSRI